MSNFTRTYLVDVVDAEEYYGVWETWEIPALTKDEARGIAQARLEQLCQRRLFGLLAPRAKGSFVVGHHIRHKR